MKKLRLPIFAAIFTVFAVSCGGGSGSETEKKETAAPKSMVAKEEPLDPMQNKGIGPVKELILPDAVDMEMAANGQKIYEEMCTACHKADKKYIGPAPLGILERRTPEWIMNMILNPEEMLEKDPIAKQLLGEANGAPMANQHLTQEQARQVLEYFRTLK